MEPQEDDDDDEDQVNLERLTSEDAWMFPIVSETRYTTICMSFWHVTM